MTWWLQGEAAGVPPAPETPDLPITSFGEGISAAFATVNRDTDVFNEFEGRVLDDLTDTSLDIVKRLGPEAVKAALASQGLLSVLDEPLDATFFRYSDKARDAVLKLGEDAAAVEPDMWTGVDLTRDGAEARVTEAQKREAQEQAQIIAMSPYPMAASILGGIASATVDPRQIPLLLLNPGGSLLKVMGWQALLGAGGEAITLPSQFDTAERLGEPQPNVMAQLGFAAAGGAILGGLAEGAARLPGVIRGTLLQRERARPVAGTDKPHVEPAIAAAEEAIVRDAPVEPAIRSALPPEEAPPIDFEAMWREADAATDWEAVLREAQARADEPQGDTSVQDYEAAPPSRDVLRADAQTELRRIEAELKKTAKWFSRSIKRRGGIHPEGQIADELRHAGITHKSMPGLFSRKGARDLDNIAAEDADAIAAIGAEGFYLDRQGVIDGLITELTGGRLQTPRDTAFMADADNLRATLRDLDVEDQIDAAAGPDMLTPKERMYVKERVKQGDDPADAIHDAIARQVDEAEAQEVPNDVYEREINWEPFADEGAQPAGTGAAGAGGPVGSDQGGNAQGAGAAGAGSDFSVEATPAGEQLLIPGTEARAVDTSRDKALADLQARQSKMRRLDQMDPDGLFAPKQMAIFDDLTSPQAGAYLDAQIAEMRASIDPENPTATSVEADDGRILATTQDVLREIDELDQMEREFAACLAGGVNVGA
jgi:hypothetical protein